LGPSFGAGQLPITPAGQLEIDLAIADAIEKRNEIACVAMDYSVTPSVNGNAPFAREFIFGPDGRLLSSINLDGRGEKFMPGACVACHGGSNYVGQFPEDGSGLPDLGSHFLPYDAGNFLFSSEHGLREDDQERAIKALNLIVLNGAGPTVAEANLINAWHAPNLTAPSLKKDFIPANWDLQDGGAATGIFHQAYHKIIAPMCRTCHAAMPDKYNFDAYFDRGSAAPGDDPTYYEQICGGSTRISVNYSMPNSLVTFNRFWSTANTDDDLSVLWSSIIDYVNGANVSATCPLYMP
jgi:hypothetical protein